MVGADDFQIGCVWVGGLIFGERGAAGRKGSTPRLLFRRCMTRGKSRPKRTAKSPQQKAGINIALHFLRPVTNAPHEYGTDTAPQGEAGRKGRKGVRNQVVIHFINICLPRK